MTKKQYRKHGDYNPWQARNRFGSWNEAKASAGIYKENTETEKVTEEELLDDLKQVKQSQGQIDIKTYREHGNHSPTTFYHKFSSFTEAVKKLDT